MKQLALLLGFLGCLGLPHGAKGQQPASARLTFNHTAVCVRDLGKSVAFYHNVLGLDELPNPFNDGIHAWFRVGPGLQLHVIQRGCTAEPNKNVHTCFSVGSLAAFTRHLDALGAAYTNLKGDGKEPTLRIDGVRQIYLQDPDGYWIEVNDAK